MKLLEISDQGNLSLIAKTKDRREKVAIRGSYPHSELARFLFMQLGLVYLIAPHLPRTISTDFPVSPLARTLLEALYQSEKQQPPVVLAKESDEVFHNLFVQSSRAVVAHSGGKDSLWNMWWAQEEYGPKNILSLHVKGMSKGNAHDEWKYSQRQAAECDFQNFEVIDLLDSSGNRGYQVMRAREFFMTGIMIPHAIEFGASQIITEGDAEAPSDEPFSGTGNGVRLFNNLLADIGIPIEVAWRDDRKEMDVVKDLLDHKPSWLPLVCNCFAPANYRIHRRNAWARNAPSFPLYESQCGSCVKCRIINLARILHDPEFAVVRREDIGYFLKNTKVWMRRNHDCLSDMIQGSFSDYFQEALCRYPNERS